ncbi:DUF3291 domain-containing protein [Streptomyces sp. NPDC060223]|uniref:DUF3291 domain-containing protein n=1 Tax=unclassified Streptomyces TaxID=2593676 RepID=UPI00363D0B45
MPQLALYTFGVLKRTTRSPGRLTQEFDEFVGAIYGGMEHIPGYVTHAMPTDFGEGAYFDWDFREWGEFVAPNWYEKGRGPETTALAATMSVWADVQSAYKFVYTELHRTALNRRYDWFEKTGHPSHALWWVTDGTIPTWEDAVPRLEHLQDHEPTPYAFTLQNAFTSDGASTRSREKQPIGKAAEARHG